MRVKIQGGTADHGAPSLCLSCRWATVIRGPQLNHEVIVCKQMYPERRITFRVVHCTGFSDRQLATLREMEEIAWILRSDTLRKRVGFVRSSELEDEDRFVLEED